MYEYDNEGLKSIFWDINNFREVRLLKAGKERVTSKTTAHYLFFSFRVGLSYRLVYIILGLLLLNTLATHTSTAGSIGVARTS